MISVKGFLRLLYKYNKGSLRLVDMGKEVEVIDLENKNECNSINRKIINFTFDKIEEDDVVITAEVK